ncbi:MAG TPA: hypothetical protein VMU82_01025 [Acetobacteraceae bacterium]|nr:hypothetical protein [Acetobacteraceae bacterium]
MSVLSFIVLETVAALWRNLFFNCSGIARTVRAPLDTRSTSLRDQSPRP